METFTTRTVATGRPSPEYFSCLLKNPIELIAEMEVNNYELYRKYISGNRMAKNGNILISVGGVLTFVGIVSTIIYAGGNDNPPLALVGLTSLVAGPICLAAGIPTFVVGKNRRKGAERDYCQQQYSALPDTHHFQINIYSNRMGLAYVF